MLIKAVTVVELVSCTPVRQPEGSLLVYADVEPSQNTDALPVLTEDIVAVFDVCADVREIVPYCILLIAEAANSIMLKFTVQALLASEVLRVAVTVVPLVRVIPANVTEALFPFSGSFSQLVINKALAALTLVIVAVPVV